MNYGKFFGWKTNPFTFRILPQLFVGFGREVEEITDGLGNGDKFSLVLGPTGSGKTTFMRHIYEKQKGRSHIIYLPKPPKNSEDWLTIFRELTKSRLPFLRRKVTLYNLTEVMNRKLKGKKCLLFIDECHEASIESLEWLRAITDQTENLSIVLAGLPVFDGMLREELETFSRRISKRVELGNLGAPETRELIKKRVEHSGGDDIQPFTSKTIEFIFEKTGGFPREVLRMCSEFSQKAMEKNISTIDMDFLKESEPQKRFSQETVTGLPERQKSILDVLTERGELSPSEIISNLKLDDYKSRDNAVRSVNNLLRRLMKEGLVERKRIGKTYKYRSSSSVQTMLVTA